VSVAASLGLAANAFVGIAQQQRAEPQLHAPKAQLLRLILDGLFGGSPVLESIAVVLGVVVVFGLPMFLAWDFAKGAGRRKWVWVTFAALASWLVLPALWIASSHRTESGP
jgi:hypothetical protein